MTLSLVVGGANLIESMSYVNCHPNFTLFGSRSYKDLKCTPNLELFGVGSSKDLKCTGLKVLSPFV